MNDNFNTKIINLKQNIIKTIGEAELPVGVVYYILKDLFEEITNVYNQSIALEQSLSENNEKEQQIEVVFEEEEEEDKDKKDNKEN